MIYLLNFFFIFFSLTAHAGFLDLPRHFIDPCFKDPIAGGSLVRAHYYKPNETRPHRAREIIGQASKGVYFSVGTERGFLTAIQAPQITHLLLGDYDQWVCLYNNINFVLLKMSKGNRELYRHLRQESSLEEWKVNAKKVELTQREQKLVSESFFKFWREALKPENNSREDHVRVDFEEAPTPYHFIGDIHYLYNDQAFAKVYNFVSSGRIQSIVIDLSKSESLQALGRAMSKAKLSLSIMDISNAWWDIYLGLRGVDNLVNTLDQDFPKTEHTLLLGTGNSSNFEDEDLHIPSIEQSKHYDPVDLTRYAAFTIPLFLERRKEKPGRLPLPAPFFSKPFHSTVDFNKVSSDPCGESLKK